MRDNVNDGAKVFHDFMSDLVVLATNAMPKLPRGEARDLAEAMLDTLIDVRDNSALLREKRNEDAASAKAETERMEARMKEYLNMTPHEEKAKLIADLQEVLENEAVEVERDWMQEEKEKAIEAMEGEDTKRVVIGNVVAITDAEGQMLGVDLELGGVNRKVATMVVDLLALSMNTTAWRINAVMTGRGE